MAKIVCITSGLTGILNASFELVARLQSDGHDLVYASPKPVEERVRQQGIPYVQLPPILPEPGPELPAFRGPLRKLSRWWYKVRHAQSRRREALEKLDPKGFDQLLTKQKPDLLIVDIELHEYIFKAHARKVPQVLLSQWFSLWNRAGLPYLLHDTIPGKGWQGKPAMIAFSWWKVKLQRWWMFAKKRWTSVYTDRRTILLDLARQEGFPLAYLKENYWPGPFTYAHLPVISMTAQEMEFPHSPRPRLYYVGPQVYAQRIDPPASGAAPWSLEEILAHRQKTGAALIYCSVSTLSSGDQSFIRNLAQAVAPKKHWLLLIGLGGLLQGDLLGQLPENVFAFSRVPQLKVLQEADCSINHGGIHTINECIHFQVPMLVYSGKRSDQNGCAARVAFHGLGIMADKDKDQPRDIRTKIQKVLEEPTYRQNIQLMHQFYQTYKKERSVEKTINSLLSSRLELTC